MRSPASGATASSTRSSPRSRRSTTETRASSTSCSAACSPSPPARSGRRCSAEALRRLTPLAAAPSHTDPTASHPAVAAVCATAAGIVFTLNPIGGRHAERFGRTTDYETPVVESTGSGGGLKLFCAGMGTDHPDITNASRRIKKSEVEKCASNGITDIIEVKIGYDGIAVANSRKAPDFKLSLRDIYLALAKSVPTDDGKTIPNPNQTWRDVNPDLPAKKIEVMGPPPTSGTRDAFAELGLEGGCKTFDWVKALKKQDKNAYKALCHEVREDGAYVEAGENDNLIVQKLDANPDALGVFGYSFLDQNLDTIPGAIVNGVRPTFERIAAGEYPMSRPLYFYVKKAHVGVIPCIEAYMAEFTRESTSGPDGYFHALSR